MTLPKDPMILLSYVNTRLRDDYSSLEAFCGDTETSCAELEETLAEVGFVYDSETNRFR